jgi:hypothetical protein
MTLRIGCDHAELRCVWRHVACVRYLVQHRAVAAQLRDPLRDAQLPVAHGGVEPHLGVLVEHPLQLVGGRLVAFDPLQLDDSRFVTVERVHEEHAGLRGASLERVVVLHEHVAPLERAATGT